MNFYIGKTDENIKVKLDLILEYKFFVCDKIDSLTAKPYKFIKLESLTNKKYSWQLTHDEYSHNVPFYLQIDDKVYTPKDILNDLTNIRLLFDDEYIKLKMESLLDKD